MAYIRDTNWKDYLDQWQAVKDKCNQIIGSLGIPKEREKKDVRTLAFIQFRQFCNTLAFAPIILHLQYKNCRGNDIKKTFRLPDEKALNSFLTDLNDNCKASFVTMAQFALENCVSRVIEAVGQKVDMRFSKNVIVLSEATNLANKNIKREILMVPAWIRNSLHRGGIPSFDSDPVNIDGKQYLFIKGQRVSCTTWSHIFHAYSHCLDIYQEMLSSPLVKAVNHIPAE